MTVVAIGNPTNGGKDAISKERPYAASITVEGTAAILFHAWNCEAVEEKARARKGSAAKKSDDVESYVHRNEAGEICIPGEYFRQSIVHAAKYVQDPRSPRKSAMDIAKAGIIALDELCSLGATSWDYLDRRRVSVQRAGVTRVRPAMLPGWRVTLTLQVLIPEYIDPPMLNELLTRAGRLVGVGDFRPTFGRFNVVNFEVLS